MIRVVVVDDQDLIRVGTAMVLGVAEDVTVVGEAADGYSAIDRVAELDPDVVLMDLRMPGMDGIEATRRLVQSGSRSAVLALTTFDLDEYAFGALHAGAAGFLLKDAPPSELLTAIRVVARGDSIVSPRVTRLVLDHFRSSLPALEKRPTDTTADLTDREREVFLAMARGLNNAEIAAELFLSDSTVKTYVGRVMAKLQARDRVHVVIRAYELNLI